MNPTLDPITPDNARFGQPATQPGVVRVAIVDDNDNARAEFTKLINAETTCRVVRSCPDAESALNDLPRFNPQVIILDINLPGMDGVECVRRLKEQLPTAHVVIFSECEDQARLLASLVAGASGYLLKRTPPGRLISAIREVCEGGVPMSPEIARRVLQQLRQNSGAPAEKVKLTPREQEIMEQLSKGFRYKEIVDNLGISFGTLHSYISKVYEKLQVHSRTEAVVKYLNL
jgi:DNA-binding NarL/FixJ family response regulator